MLLRESELSSASREYFDGSIDPRVLRELIQEIHQDENSRPKKRRLVQGYLDAVKNKSTRRRTKQQTEQTIQNFLARMDFYETRKATTRQLTEKLFYSFDWNSNQILFYPRINGLRERDEPLAVEAEEVTHQQTIHEPNESHF